MKTTSSSVLIALSAALAVTCVPVRPEVQELSSRSEVVGLHMRRGDDSLARRAPSYQHRRDDITMIEARVVTIEERNAANANLLPARAVSSTSTSTTPVLKTITATATGIQFYRENEAAKENLALTLSKSPNATATAAFYRGVSVTKRDAEAKKVVEPNCFEASTSEDDGCVVNLS